MGLVFAFSIIPLGIAFGLLYVLLQLTFYAAAIVAVLVLLPALAGLAIYKFTDLSDRPSLCIAGLLLAAELVFLVGYFRKPVDLDLPDREEVTAVALQEVTEFSTRTEVDRQVTVSAEEAESLLEVVCDGEYKHHLDLRWPWDKEDKDAIRYYYSIELQDAGGNVLKTIRFYEGEDQLVRPLTKGGRAIRLYAPSSSDMPLKQAESIFDQIEYAEVEARWQDFIDTFRSSISYDDEKGEVSFVIPEAWTRDSCRLYIHARGMGGWQPGQSYTGPDLHFFKEAQDAQSWEPGGIYTMQLSDIAYERLELRLVLDGQAFVSDLCKVVHARYVYP